MSRLNWLRARKMNGAPYSIYFMMPFYIIGAPFFIFSVCLLLDALFNYVTGR
jgi:hypothetical protein